MERGLLVATTTAPFLFFLCLKLSEDMGAKQSHLKLDEVIESRWSKLVFDRLMVIRELNMDCYEEKDDSLIGKTLECNLEILVRIQRLFFFSFYDLI